MIPKIVNLGDTVDFWEHYLSYFYAIFVVQTCQGTPWIITKLLPNQIKPLEALFWVVFAHFLTKIPKSKWIWFGVTYPLIWDIVSGIKILVPPFDQFKKHHLCSTDMWSIIVQWSILTRGIDIIKLETRKKW